MKARFVERLARHKVDGARDIAFQHVRGRVFENLNTAQQFRRNVIERQFPATIGRKDFAAIQVRQDIGQSANDNA